MIFTRARVSLALLSLEEKWGTTRSLQNFESPIPISSEVTIISSVFPSPETENPIHPFVFPNMFL